MFQLGDSFEEDVDSVEWLGSMGGDEGTGDKEVFTDNGVCAPPTKRPAKFKELSSAKRQLRVHPRMVEKVKDSDDIFAQYIASEMRAISDVQAKRLAKWKIHNAIFEAQTGLASPYPQLHPQYHTVHVDNAIPISVNEPQSGTNTTTSTT